MSAYQRRPVTGPPVFGPQVRRRANRAVFTRLPYTPIPRLPIRSGPGWLEYEIGSVPPGRNQLSKLPRIQRQSSGQSQWSIESEWTSASYNAALRAMSEARFPRAVEGELRRVTVTMRRVRRLDPGHREDSVTPIVNALKAVLRREKVGDVLVPIAGAGVIFEDDDRCIELYVRQETAAHYADQYTVVRVEIV